MQPPKQVSFEQTVKDALLKMVRNYNSTSTCAV